MNRLAKQRLEHDPSLRRTAGAAASPFHDYRFDPERYIVEKLGWTPWRGTPDKPGQAEVLDAYALALRQQYERLEYERGEKPADALAWWQPGQVIQNRIRVEAGHTVGKTTLAAGLISHFFDCFIPGVGYCFAPSDDQINDLLFKEIRKQRDGRGLPGRVLQIPEIKHRGDHFVKGRATSNAGGKGTERVQGQHEQHLIFVLDEAEGIEDYVWDALESMTSGGIVIVIMLANPRTRLSRFHKAASDERVRSFRISCIWHPNVVQGREVVPGAVRREYVDGMVALHCQTVQAHNDDDHTFELPWQPGVIYQPNAEMLFRVLGVAPKNLADNTLVPVGRFEAAAARTPVSQRPTEARLGLDCARFGKDVGTLYVRHDGRVWREARFPQLTTGDYFRATKAAIMRLVGQGVTDVQVRVDGGGGFGGGVIDRLREDVELGAALKSFVVHEVHFGGTENIDQSAYVDVVTQMYAESAESLKSVAVVSPPSELEADLCERTYKWMNRAGVDVKKLAPKDEFKKQHGRSPDDGDGFVLALAPDHLFDAPGQVLFF